MAMTGTIPEPPATSCTGSVWSWRQTNHPPIGPRTSTWSPTARSRVRNGGHLAVLDLLHGDIDPVIVAPPAAEAMEYERTAA
jgi:hypothetical protein